MLPDTMVAIEYEEPASFAFAWLSDGGLTIRISSSRLGARSAAPARYFGFVDSIGEDGVVDPAPPPGMKF
jgi:hypothetical protein